MDMLQIRSNSTFASRIASFPRVCNQSRPLKESDQEFIQDIRTTTGHLSVGNPGAMISKDRQEALQRCQTLPYSILGQLGDAADLELFHDVLAIGFDRFDADTETVGNLGGTGSFGQKL